LSLRTIIDSYDTLAEDKGTEIFAYGTICKEEQRVSGVFVQPSSLSLNCENSPDVLYCWQEIRVQTAGGSLIKRSNEYEI
jgi:hypothetical protein